MEPIDTFKREWPEVVRARSSVASLVGISVVATFAFAMVLNDETLSGKNATIESLNTQEQGLKTERDDLAKKLGVEAGKDANSPTATLENHVVQSGQGGSGGNVGSISGERLDIELGKAGAGGCGGVGGAGGGAGPVNGSDIRVHTGQGGDAASCDGLGADRVPGGAELQNWPTEMWKFGYGGRGGDTTIGKHRIEVLRRIRSEYMAMFPEDVSHIEAGVFQAPINWVNKRLEELNETWRVTEGENGYALPRLDSNTKGPSD
jgi:hypothetical protein